MTFPSIPGLSKHLKIASVVVLSTMFGASVVQAAVLNFDDQPSPGGPHDTDIYGDFQVSPSGGNKDTKCFPENSGCLKEVSKDEITRLSRVDGGTFTLDSFYFVLVGDGNLQDNTFSVLGSNSTLWEATLGDLLSGFSPAATVSFVNGTPDSHVSDGTVERNQGYVVDFSDLAPLFAGVTYIDFKTDATKISNGQPGSAQARLDCVVVDMATTAGICDPTLPAVPIPASFPLLVTALGLTGLVGRRRFGRRKFI